jgi:hypothetical protein
MILRKGPTVDESIARLANEYLGDVVSISEGNRISIGRATGRNAADFLVSRLYTDAIFSQDIRCIQLIINRIDGGLPKDTDIAMYQTEFGDCLNAVLDMDRSEQTMVGPGDTVMMALCKSLFQIATQDIYWDYDKKKSRRPSDTVKKERDAAMRMILERTGGRKTLSSVPNHAEEVEIAGWIEDLSKNTC